MNVWEPVRHCTRTPDAIMSKWLPEIPTKVATKTVKFITYTKTHSRLKKKREVMLHCKFCQYNIDRKRVNTRKLHLLPKALVDNSEKAPYKVKKMEFKQRKEKKGSLGEEIKQITESSTTLLIISQNTDWRLLTPASNELFISWKSPEPMQF